jgi:hypothetical protein
MQHFGAKTVKNITVAWTGALSPLVTGTTVAFNTVVLNAAFSAMMQFSA